MSIRRLAAASLLAPLLAAVTAAPALADGPPAAATAATRISGADRIATAVAVSTAAYPDGADTVLLARWDAFPDALAGAYLAGELSAPMLLTQSDELSAGTADAIEALGADDVVVLGGTGAVSQGIEDQLEADGLGVRRVAGADRFSTAAAIARAGGSVGTAPSPGDERLRTAIVATGRDFPDALAAGPLSAIGAHPLLLTEPTALPGVSASAIEELDIDQVVVLGGQGAVSSQVIDQLRAAGGPDMVVARVAGADRFETAARTARVTTDLLDLDGTTVLAATGRNFPDALALAALGDQRRAPIVLSDTDAFTAPSHDFVDKLCGAVDELVIAGGTAAVSQRAALQSSLATTCADVVVPLSGAKEVASPGDDDGAGIARLYTDPEADALCYAIAATGIEPATAAHIHFGASDVDGPVLAPLATPDGSGYSAGCVDGSDLTDETDATTAGELAAGIERSPGEFYVNVHNTPLPGGAVRANLGHDDVRELQAIGGATGSGSVGFTLLQDRFCFEIEVDALDSDAVVAYLQDGSGIRETLLVGLARQELVRGDCVTIEPELRQEIVDAPEDFFVSVRSRAQTGGALRATLAD